MFVGRGVVQISAYVDTVLASLLPTGAVAALSYAQVLYTLPVSLFGMSVSAAELPAMASAAGDASERAAYLRERLDAGLRQIAFFVVPSAVAFLALGDVVAGALYQTGAFTRAMTRLRLGHSRRLRGRPAGVHAGAALRLDLLRAARHPDAAPLRLVRVALTIVLGYLFALPLPRAARARPALGRRGPHGVGRDGGLGRVRPPARGHSIARIGATGAAGGADGAAVGRRGRGGRAPPGASGSPCSDRAPAASPRSLLLAVYGAVYFFITDRLGLPEAAA